MSATVSSASAVASAAMSADNCVDILASADADESISPAAKEDVAPSASASASPEASLDGSLFLVSAEMRQQEQAVRQENAKLEAKKNASDVRALEKMSEEERYSRLMDLLGKSKFYSEFLLKKMSDEDDAKRLKEQKFSDRKKMKEDEVRRQSGAGAQGDRKEGAKVRRGAGRRAQEQQSEEAKKRKRAEAEESCSPDAKKAKKKPELLRTFNGEEIDDHQPLLLTGGVMRDYQIKGYQWMATLFENGINGILADEMGLGKTIQTISLFCHLVEMGVPGPYLIVAPLSTVPNWVKEFKRFAPCLPVVLYHGSRPERESLRARHLNETTSVEGIDKPIRNVFVTSYEIAMNDRAHFRRVLWRYIVVDEGHRLKNMKCRLIRELKQYESVNRLLLTGTPLQNNLAELWSLLNFLMAEIFDDLSVFESWFNAKDMDESEGEETRIMQQEKQNNILSTLHQILTPFLLRRIKADVDLKIPPKKELLVYCPMSEKQREFYEATVNKTLAEVVGNREGDEDSLDVSLSNVDLENSGRGKRRKESIDYSVFLGNDGVSERNLEEYVNRVSEMAQKREAGMMASKTAYNKELERAHLSSECKMSLKNRMMDLRKTTNHPYLIEHPLSEDGMFYKADQDMIDCCGKLKVLDQLLGELMKRNHKILIFSQMTRMLDILGDYLNFKSISFSRLDGSMNFEDRQANIDSFNEDEGVRVFLLSTRAGGLGINLTAADTCIIYDSDWNPQQDLQAQDRCHRIGQTKPVIVYRLVTAATIDQKIVERAAAKRRLEKMIIHSKKFKSQDKDGLKKTMEAINPHELLELLHSRDHVGQVDRSDGTVFTEKEMEALLDRSDLRWGKGSGVANGDVKDEAVDKENSEPKPLPKSPAARKTRGGGRSSNSSTPTRSGRSRKSLKKEEPDCDEIPASTEAASSSSSLNSCFKVIDLEEGSSTLLLKSVKDE